MPRLCFLFSLISHLLFHYPSEFSLYYPFCWPEMNHEHFLLLLERSTMNIQTGVKMMVHLNKAATVDIYEEEARTAQYLQYSTVQPSTCSVSVPMSGPGRPPTSGASVGPCPGCVTPVPCHATAGLICHCFVTGFRLSRVSPPPPSVCSKYRSVAPHPAQEITFYISPP